MILKAVADSNEPMKIPFCQIHMEPFDAAIVLCHEQGQRKIRCGRQLDNQKSPCAHIKYIATELPRTCYAVHVLHELSRDEYSIFWESWPVYVMSPLRKLDTVKNVSVSEKRHKLLNSIDTDFLMNRIDGFPMKTAKRKMIDFNERSMRNRVGSSF